MNLLTYTGEAKALPVSTLAYIGDAVYELYTRMYVLTRCEAGSGKLHRLTVHFVKAAYQAQAARRLTSFFSQAESAIFKRGRNTEPGSVAKNADPIDYRLASGLETLVGWLYLTNQAQRLDEVMTAILNESEDSDME